MLTFIRTHSRYAVQWNIAFDITVMMFRRLYSHLQMCHSSVAHRWIKCIDKQADKQEAPSDRYPHFFCLLSLRYVRQVSKSLFSLYFLSAISQCPSLTYSKL